MTNPTPDILREYNAYFDSCEKRNTIPLSYPAWFEQVYMKGVAA